MPSSMLSTMFSSDAAEREVNRLIEEVTRAGQREQDKAKRRGYRETYRNLQRARRMIAIAMQDCRARRAAK